jgi:hypothetical protein
MRFLRDSGKFARLLLLTTLVAVGTASCGGDNNATPSSQTVVTVQTVSFTSGSGSETHNYTGTSLWTLLNQIGITTNPAVKNDVLAKYVVATGSDNYRSLFAMGEVDADFGNRGNELVYAETIGGVSSSLSSAVGPVRITAPGDVKGGRYVSNLVKVEVHTAVSTVTASGGGTSTQFQLLGAIANPTTFNLADLQALPVVTRTVGTSTYTGVSLWNLINAAGIQTNAAVKNDLLGFYVIATGTDGYRVVLSAAELSPDFGNQPDIVAYAVNGAPLGTTGFARLVIPNDSKAGRYVSNLVALEVVTAPH